jgi:hypothetical protein
MESNTKYVIESYKENGEFVGFLALFDATGRLDFSPQASDAYLFDTEKECIFLDGAKWELGRGGGKGYYKVVKIEKKVSKKPLTPMHELINELESYKEGLSGQNVNLINSIQHRIEKQFIKKEKRAIIEAYAYKRLIRKTFERVTILMQNGEKYYNEKFETE